MYRVTICNDGTATIIHEISVDPADPHLYSCTLTQGAPGEIDSLEFTILPNNPGYELLNSRTTLIEVYNSKTDEIEFSGRVLTITPEMQDSGLIYKSAVCESRLGYLCDSIQPYTEEATYTLEEFFTLLLENHNSQVEDYKKIYPGTVTAESSASTGNVTKALNYETTWGALSDKLLSTEGGEIELREGDDGLLYLDYVTELGDQIDTVKIELGVNMKSITREIDPTEIVTRLIPLGAKLEDAEGNETEERLTIADVNDGVIYLDDEKSQETYGIVVGTVTWDDVTVASNLLTKGTQWLQQQAVSDKISLTAYDLWLIGLAEDSIRRYNYYQVINEAIGLSRYYRVVKRTVDICDPANITYEMGERASSLGATIISTQKQAESEASERAAAINRLANKLASSSGLYMTTEEQDDGSIIYYMHNQPTLAESDIIWKLTAEAFAISTDGGQTYPYGFTVTGEMIMQLIYAEGINADYINSGTLTVTDSNGNVMFMVNIDTGEVCINAATLTIQGTPTLVSATTYYTTSSSTTELDDDVEWSQDQPTKASGTYIWAKTVYVYSDGTSGESTPVCISGLDGTSGTSGTGIASQTYYYLLSDQATGVTIETVDEYLTDEDGNQLTDEDGNYFYVSSSTWSTEPLTMTSTERYLWSYLEIVYTDGTTYTTTPCVIGAYGDTGEQGIQGIQGEQGIAGTDGKTSYFHIKYSAVENPTADDMTETPSAYIGTYVDYTEADSTNPDDYTWTKWLGEDGEQGIAGTNGADGVTYYLHIAYANSEDGATDFSISDSTDKEYIGVYTDTEADDSTDYTKYAWSKIKGDTGAAGADGLTFYTWIKYADDENGTNMSDDPEDKAYIGLAYNQTEQTESTDPADYTWSKMRGDDGADGTNGTDGETYYTWVKYADDEDGTNMSNDPTDKFYIGIAYNQTSETESNDPADYTWSLFRGSDGVDGSAGVGIASQTMYYLLSDQETGIEIETEDEYLTDEDGNQLTDEDGNYLYVSSSTWSTEVLTMTSDERYLWSYTEIVYTNGTVYTSDPCVIGVYGIQGLQGIQGEQGEQGIAGTDGKTSYFHIKYSAVEDPTESDLTETPSTYIGTYVDYNEDDSTDPADYNWTKWLGSDGADGIAGVDGTDGTTYYLHIAYATSSDGATGFSVSDSSGKTYIGQYVDTESADSEDPTKYKWTLIKGEDGLTYYTWVKYADDSSGTNMSDDPEGKVYIGLAYNKTTATESTDASDYTWSQMRGDDGADGKGISSVTAYYAAGSSATEQPSTPSTSAWSTSVPELTLTQYLWVAYYVVYTDGTSSWVGVMCLTDTTVRERMTSVELNMDDVNGIIDLLVSTDELEVLQASETTLYSQYQEIVIDIEGITQTVNSTVTTLYGDDDTSGLVDLFEDSALTIEDLIALLTDSDGNYISVESLQSQIEQLPDEVAITISSSLASYEATQDGILTTLDEYATYFSFTSDGLRISDSDSDFALLLASDRISFMESDSEVAYISDSMLYIYDANIVNSLQLGNFKWMPRESGNLSLVYVGGE